MPEKEAPVEAQRRNHQPAAAPKDEIPIRPITYFALLIAIFGLAVSVILEIRQHSETAI